VGGIPRDAAGWFELIHAGMAPFWRLLAEGSGGSVWTEEGTLAAVVPQAAERSIFNSVFYEDAGRLLGSLEEIARTYDEAGVNAWTVWVPESDDRAADGLEEAGHVLDANPMAMGMEIAELRAPEPEASIEIREELDMAEVARLNEIAYGWPAGDFGAVAEAQVPDSYAYFASLDGETVGTAVAWDHGDDSEITWVATLPEARGRGVSKQLMTRALVDAAKRGRLTTTLVATQLGRPVYERLGYRAFGTFQMWERRSA
jgi:GNAT superfamily N-acetyltransferase